MDNARLTIRAATLADLPGLHRVAERAVWGLLASHYTERQMDATRRTRGYQVEAELVRDGTYYVLEVDGVLVGGSGWSGQSGFHPPLAGGAATELEPPADVAVMRATYIDPDWARRGLASLLVRVTETAATLAGFECFEALCTPASEALRRELGYRVLARVDVPLIDTVSIRMAHMRKERVPSVAPAG
jgi:GNAT superfamily N-acetyltransferase